MHIFVVCSFTEDPWLKEKERKEKREEKKKEKFLCLFTTILFRKKYNSPPKNLPKLIKHKQQIKHKKIPSKTKQ